MAIAAERGGRETLAMTFILDGDVHLNERPAELAEHAEPPWDVALREIARIGGEFHVPTGQCMAWPEIKLRTFAVTVVDGEIEVAL